MLTLTAPAGFGAGVHVIRIVIDGNRTDYDLAADLQASHGWDGAAPVNVHVTVNAGVTIDASSTAVPAFAIDLPAGSRVTLVNNGDIIGRGGKGGAPTATYGGAGTAGGTALWTNVATIIDNQGIIAGGGGGGGAGGSGLSNGGIRVYGAGGGGGAAYGLGSGTGADGSKMSGGAGGPQVWNANTVGGAGGDGGDLGDGGNAGAAGWGDGSYWGGGSGGAAGKYLTGAANVTWINVGDVRGPSA